MTNQLSVVPYPSDVVTMLRLLIANVIASDLGAISPLVCGPRIPVLSELEHTVNMRLLVYEREKHVVRMQLSLWDLLGGRSDLIELLFIFVFVSQEGQYRRVFDLLLDVIPRLCSARLFFIDRFVLLRVHCHLDFNSRDAVYQAQRQYDPAVSRHFLKCYSRDGRAPLDRVRMTVFAFAAGSCRLPRGDKTRVCKLGANCEALFAHKMPEI